MINININKCPCKKQATIKIDGCYFCDDCNDNLISEEASDNIRAKALDFLTCFGCEKAYKKDNKELFYTFNDPITKKRYSDNLYCYDCLEKLTRKDYESDTIKLNNIKIN